MNQLPEIIKYPSAVSEDVAFCIVIPSWNNLPYLQLCLRSIRENSALRHQIIVLVNDGSDGTVEWLRQQSDIACVHARENIGICLGLNVCRSLIAARYVVYANDDMYFLPGWDVAFQQEISRLSEKHFMLSVTMVEPNGKNPCCLIRDFGTDLESFREQELLAASREFVKHDWSGASWPPSLMPTETWDLVGGMSVEFSPGMYSDPDLSRKLWHIGVRYFKGLGNGFVYHFGSKSTKRMRKNKGKTQFLKKWGITSRFFYEKYLKLGTPFTGRLQEVDEDSFSFRWHRLIH